MAEEFETVELEYSEEDILYYLVDEDGNEVGFVIEEDGEEVECYYEGFDGEEFEVVIDEADGAEVVLEAEGDEVVVEMEIDEDSILYYLVDEDGNEVGFVIEEDGVEIECYFEEEQEDGPASEPEPAEPEPSEPEEPGYLRKMASIAGFHGNRARKKAEVGIDKVRGVAEKQVDKATDAVETHGKKLKDKKDEMDLGITREDVSKTTEDLNVIAREGAATVKELKGTYDDLMEEFGFLVPKKIKRRLPH